MVVGFIKGFQADLIFSLSTNFINVPFFQVIAKMVIGKTISEAFQRKQSTFLRFLCSFLFCKKYVSHEKHSCDFFTLEGL